MKANLKLLLPILFVGIVLFPTSSIKACTEIRVNAKDSTVITTRSMEFEVDLKSEIVTQPRGKIFVSKAPESTKGLQWTNKYGYVYMNALGYPIAVDGLNEEGLSFGALYLPGYAEYQTVPSGQGEKALWNLDFGSWILGNFKNVEEVRKALGSIYVWQDSAIVISPLHFNITDAHGNSIIVEYTADGLKVYDNKLGVLTNSPPYDWHIANISNYLNLSPYNPDSISFNGETFSPLGQGAGLVGLPGDWSPPSRFIKSAMMVHLADTPQNSDEAVNLALHFLNVVDIPKGVSRIVLDGKEEQDYTQWIVVRDLTNRRYMFRTYENMQLRSVDLNKLDLSNGAKSVTIKISGGNEIIDISNQLVKK